VKVEEQPIIKKRPVVEVAVPVDAGLPEQLLSQETGVFAIILIQEEVAKPKGRRIVREDESHGFLIAI